MAQTKSSAVRDAEGPAPARAKVTSRGKRKSSAGQDELSQLALKACLIARDATFNLKDLLNSSSRVAFLAVRDCEKELDVIERQIDERLPDAITRVDGEKARELLACLKFITDLERIGDLTMSVANRLRSGTHSVPAADTRLLTEMCDIVHGMLDRVHSCFIARDLESAREVLRTDGKIDRICHSMFQKHLAGHEENKEDQARRFMILLMAQALERAGDHAKNLAEELYGLIEGHTLRHPPKQSSN